MAIDNCKEECLVSVVVTDETVFSKLEERKQPPSLASAVYLETEIHPSASYELYHINDYLANDTYLDLLMGV